MAALGETPDLPIALADIFGGELDFNSELQPGDRFQLIVEKLYRDHRLVKYGPILAATSRRADGRSLVCATRRRMASRGITIWRADR